MIKIKHTPGPWALEPKNDHINIFAKADGFPVAMVELSNPTVNDYNRLEEDKANATLIAAAPDLLLAAKDAVLFLNGIAESFKIPEEMKKLAMKGLTDSIAKAEGGVA